MRIFIVGPMGSGKSTIGKKLAKSLSLDFVDTDQEIESKTGVEISWIFEKEGEKGFREREKVILKELLKRNHLVISSGGGTVLLEENRRLMNSKGKVIYLKASIELQLKRTRKDSRRPLLEKGDRRKILENLKFERNHLYSEVADIIIDQEEKSQTQIIKMILSKLSEQKND